jgi:L-ascorbate metabolism protein UlaG (beta-lactamase superfamily)
MKLGKLLLVSLVLLTGKGKLYARSADTTPKKAKKYQAKAPETLLLGSEAFKQSTGTTVHWLGMAGFMVNSRGTIFMIDPLLEGYDMPLLMKFPILPKDVPHVDAIMATHSDNDHYSVETFRDLKAVTTAYHSTIYVDSLMKNEGLASSGHHIGDTFKFGLVSAKLTPADHAWQNAFPGTSKRYFGPEDACGFNFYTPDGTIWAPGDSRLMPAQLHLPAPDLILLDYSEDSDWHFGLEGSALHGATYPPTLLVNKR